MSGMTCHELALFGMKKSSPLFGRMHVCEQKDAPMCQRRCQVRRALRRGGAGSWALTHNGGVGAVGDTGDGVDAREDGADVVLVELDSVGVREEVVAVRGRRRPVGVGAPAQDVLGVSMSSAARTSAQLVGCGVPDEAAAGVCHDCLTGAHAKV